VNALTPTRGFGLHQLNAFVTQGRAGQRYTRDRNFDGGAEGETTLALPSNVSCLSPFIRHRLVLETEVLRETLRHEDPQAAEKFIQEVCWRTYWKGWLERNPQVWHRYCQERDQLAACHPALLKAIERAKQATTSIACFDYWVEQLVVTGYLHNHARMWFASIWIFTLRLPWQAGADFFMQHLCDADAAANTLSWRWVAGLQTKGKHYLARAENIARYTHGRFNPDKQLDEQAEPLVESDAPLVPLMPLATCAWQRAATESLRVKPLPKDAVLVLHEEDLCPESLAALQATPEARLVGLIVANCGRARSRGAPGEQSARFLAGALQDATTRAMQHWRLLPEQVVHCADAACLEAVLNGAHPWAAQPLVTPWIPVGHVRDTLGAQLLQREQRGVPTRYLARPWDAAAWPHASKGFFSFKSNIPEFLRTQI
jgi:deoxyribodipyrimidine photo-lyase